MSTINDDNFNVRGGNHNEILNPKINHMIYDNNKNKKRNLMRTGLIGPEWTRGMIEPPEGEKDMGGWVAAVYTEEQQLRLGINEKGEKLSVNLDEDSHEPQYATARHLSYKSEGYESLGQGYFKNNFDDFEIIKC